MSSLETAITAHMDYAGERFEILVDSELARMYRDGRKKELNNVLVVEEIFKNAKKGERHKATELQKAFHTTDIFAIADIILKKGELQLTTDQKRKMLEEKRKKIIAILARECIDPRTGAVHTVMRIENAMEEARVQIDPFKDAESQIDDVIKELRLIIPMKFEKTRIAVKVGPEHAQRIYGMLREHGIQKEEWDRNGNLITMHELPAGLVGEFLDRLNKATQGSAQTKIMK
ncbi:Ribosome maturation protein SDO1 [Candidatus Anstonella stagnisolia]|nr:Ribosome maturation protein SDO1 [Candidatus Anstonella stagnisolia]